MSGVGDCISLAKRNNLLETPWGIFFFGFVVFIVGLCGGMTALLIKDWINDIMKWKIKYLALNKCAAPSLKEKEMEDEVND